MHEVVIRVSRSELLHALREVASASRDAKRLHANLRLTDRLLTVARARASASIAIDDDEEFEALVPCGFVEKPNRLLPAGETVEIGCDGASIRFGVFTWHFTHGAAEREDKILIERQRRITKVAGILGVYGMTADEVGALCLPEPLFDPVLMQKQNERVARAWTELSAYGVDPEDITYLINTNIRNAWK